MSMSAKQFVIIEANATTAAATPAFDVTHIVLLSNDGTADITFRLDNGTDFTMKKGEKLEDIPLRVKVLRHVAASGTQAFRAWGLKR